MVKHMLLAGIILAASPAVANDVTTGAVGMIVARELCPAGTIDDDKLADTVTISAIMNGQDVGDHVMLLADRAWVEKARVLERGSVDAFCRDVARAVAPRTPGN